MKNHDFLIVNCDTDSITICKPKGGKFSKEEEDTLLNELNSLMDEGIIWEDDGSYKKFLVIKAKNYVTDDGKSVKFKGSSLKDSKKEPKLKEFMLKVADLLMNNRPDHIFFLYQQYVREIQDIQDMKLWSKKVNVTKKILDVEKAEKPRENELKPFRAIKGKGYREGDKAYMYYLPNEELALLEDFDGEYNVNTYLKKLYKTLVIFENVIDVKLFANYTLSKNKGLL